MKILKIKKKAHISLINDFISKIKEKNFKQNTKINNTPWCYLKDKRFVFYFLFSEKKIIGVIVIFNNKINKHLSFFYILKKYRGNKLGSFFLKKIFLTGNRLKTIHVLKSLKKTKKFYEKFRFLTFKKNRHLNKNILKWVANCQKNDKYIYQKKYLLYLC